MDTQEKLNQRLASGEITVEQYDEILVRLKDKRSPVPVEAAAANPDRLQDKPNKDPLPFFRTPVEFSRALKNANIAVLAIALTSSVVAILLAPLVIPWWPFPYLMGVAGRLAQNTLGLTFQSGASFIAFALTFVIALILTRVVGTVAANAFLDRATMQGERVSPEVDAAITKINVSPWSVVSVRAFVGDEGNAGTSAGLTSMTTPLVFVMLLMVSTLFGMLLA